MGGPDRPPGLLPVQLQPFLVSYLLAAANAFSEWGKVASLPSSLVSFFPDWRLNCAQIGRAKSTRIKATARSLSPCGLPACLAAHRPCVPAERR